MVLHGNYTWTRQVWWSAMTLCSIFGGLIEPRHSECVQKTQSQKLINTDLAEIQISNRKYSQECPNSLSQLQFRVGRASRPIKIKKQRQDMIGPCKSHRDPIRCLHIYICTKSIKRSVPDATCLLGIPPSWIWGLVLVSVNHLHRKNICNSRPIRSSIHWINPSSWCICRFSATRPFLFARRPCMMSLLKSSPMRWSSWPIRVSCCMSPSVGGGCSL